MPDNFHIYDSESEFARNAKTIPQLLESAKFFRELSEHYRNMALSDELTGLPNRHATAAYIDGILSTVHQHGRHFGIADGFLIIACDIDKFKSINDTMGHDAGDAALTEFARRLGGSVRSKADPDNHQNRRQYDGYGIETDLVARHGGEEFLLILPMPRKDNMNIYEVSCRIQERVCGVYELGEGRSWPMSMSMGIDFISWYELEKFISEFGNDSLTSKSTQMHKFLFDGADGASYEAKNTGRARSCLWHKTTRKTDTIYVYGGPVSGAVMESRAQDAA
ncbi:MAG TPA: GGDEF domain-containing protein, partial [Alphaproteobacteria bacterium]|nr:GGDEF domain-containing protein [Alphaproteobacteria bacterium]